MSPLIETTNSITAFGTIGLFAIIVLIAIGMVNKDKSGLYKWFSENSLLLIFLLSLGGTIMSLFYSEIIEFQPCTFCWYQRIIMYSMTVITFVALIKKHSREIFSYTKVLVIIGAIIAVIHYYYQWFATSALECSVDGPSCSEIVINKFGFMSMPLMSFVVFALILIILANRKRFQN